MLDIKALRADPEQIAQALAIKGYVLDTKQFIEIEEKRKRLQSETKTLQNERNVKSKSIGQAKATVSAGRRFGRAFRQGKSRICSGSGGAARLAHEYSKLASCLCARRSRRER